MKTYTILIAILGMHFITNGSDHQKSGNSSNFKFNINAQSPGAKQAIDSGTYNQPESEFDYEGYLKEHQWEERSQNLSSEQQEKWLKFFNANVDIANKTTTREILAPLMIQGLDYVEKKDILTFAILDDSPIAIQRAVKEGFDINQPWLRSKSQTHASLT